MKICLFFAIKGQIISASVFVAKVLRAENGDPDVSCEKNSASQSQTMVLYSSVLYTWRTHEKKCSVSRGYVYHNHNSE